ncbi:hypothetical protein HNV11_10260 [Spirosoma taeanense]|uniref:Uncharacterized protein n=1 Tax=Spirosoma taeanense TaxID=2735870 RepID=A0A6M5Y764_9BACT|nr:hypothetical protein [Spirosoma taeanense]QJW89735.1 hypothetical protein HNV11_10260 [Spirosoma taeanense]
MKSALLIVAIGLSLYSPARAQSSQVIRLKGGAGGEKSVPINDRYRYDRFRDGKVLFQNGASAAARFNYNVLLGEMQFIDARGDTLAITSEPVVRLVGIGEDVFWYDRIKGYLEIRAEYPNAKLAVQQGVRTAKNEKRGGYEQSTGTSAITNYQFYSGGSTAINKLDNKGDLLLIKGTSYFIIDQNGRSYPANKASVLNVYARHRGRVTAYLEDMPVNFTQEDDLKRLLNFCSGLL